MVFCQTKILFDNALLMLMMPTTVAALFIESNGLVHIINCVTFTFGFCRKLRVQKKKRTKQNKKYDVIRFIPAIRKYYIYILYSCMARGI